MFDSHKAMQSLPANLSREVYWKTIRSSALHMCLIGVSVAWATAYVAMIVFDRHSLWSAMVTSFMFILWYPFEWIKPRRQLAASFLKMNIRPSHCAYCEFDLRGTDGDACPECGTRLALKTNVEVSEP